MESQQFPDHEFEQINIPVVRGLETDGVNEPRWSYSKVSLASDAFLLFGYSGEAASYKDLCI